MKVLGDVCYYVLFVLFLVSHGLSHIYLERHIFVKLDMLSHWKQTSKELCCDLSQLTFPGTVPKRSSCSCISLLGQLLWSLHSQRLQQAEEEWGEPSSTLAKRRKLSLGRWRFLPGKSWRLVVPVKSYNVPINFIWQKTQCQRSRK